MSHWVNRAHQTRFVHSVRQFQRPQPSRPSDWRANLPRHIDSGAFHVQDFHPIYYCNYYYCCYYCYYSRDHHPIRSTITDHFRMNCLSGPTAKHTWNFVRHRWPTILSHRLLRQPLISCLFHDVRLLPGTRHIGRQTGALDPCACVPCASISLWLKGEKKED